MEGGFGSAQHASPCLPNLDSCLCAPFLTLPPQETFLGSHCQIGARLILFLLGRNGKVKIKDLAGYVDSLSLQNDDWYSFEVWG